MTRICGVVFANPELQRWPQISGEQLAGRSFADFVVGAQAEACEIPQLSSSPPVGMNLLGLSSPAADMELQPGTSLVLFSDGLIERRDRDIESGVDFLRSSLHNAQASPDRLCDLILRTMVGSAGPVTDDVTVLIARIRATSEPR
ncbi:SpoIIE family protein phosphatase [Streptomyces cadmiisoli]|uniref:SpoIIE family protein phosphatase n=1 Tax=Streptomyces cadmiisoli TaxID=2184053 RepID=UPI003664582C